MSFSNGLRWILIWGGEGLSSMKPNSCLKLFECVVRCHTLSLYPTKSYVNPKDGLFVIIWLGNLSIHWSVDLGIHLPLHVPIWSVNHNIYFRQNCEKDRNKFCFQNVYLTIKYYPLHSKIQRYWIRHWPPPFALAFISQFDISTNIYSHIGQPKRRHPLSILPTL